MLHTYLVYFTCHFAPLNLPRNLMTYIYRIMAKEFFSSRHLCVPKAYMSLNSCLHNVTYVYVHTIGVYGVLYVATYPCLRPTSAPVCLMANGSGEGEWGPLVCLMASPFRPPLLLLLPTLRHIPPPPAAGRGEGPIAAAPTVGAPLATHRLPCDLLAGPRKWSCSFACAGWGRRRSRTGLACGGAGEV